MWLSWGRHKGGEAVYSRLSFPAGVNLDVGGLLNRMIADFSDHPPLCFSSESR